MEGLSERACAAVGGRCLHLSYAEASYPPPIPATAILPSESSGVPGLMVIPDFIGIDEEEFWLSGLCAPDSHHWQHEISRRVQVIIMSRFNVLRSYISPSSIIHSTMAIHLTMKH